MANPVKNAIAWARKNPVPIVAGAGTLAFVGAYSGRRREQAAAAAAAPPATIVAGPGGLAPGAEAALLSQGAGLASGAFALGAAPTTQALDLAGFATAGAQGLAGILAGSQASMGATLGGAFGDLVGAVAPIFDRADPAPTYVPAPSQPAPMPTPISPTTPPTSTTPPRVSETFDGYELVLLAGSHVLYSGDRSQNRRTVSISGSTSARATRVTSPWLQWRFSNGSFTGWAAIPGKTSGFYVNALYKRSDGSLRRQRV